MYPTHVIPAKRFVHKITGQTASIYGACPGFGNDMKNWEIKTIGFTTSNSDGTVGMGRTPWKSYDTAKDFVDNICPKHLRKSDILS